MTDHPILKPKPRTGGRLEVRMKNPRTGSYDNSAGIVPAGPKKWQAAEVVRLRAGWIARWESEHGAHRPAQAGGVTLSDFVPMHCAWLRLVKPKTTDRTIQSLTKRLRYAEAYFGVVPLSDLQYMVNEVIAWRATLPQRSSHGIVSAFSQVLNGAKRRRFITINPVTESGPNVAPERRPIRAYTREEIELLGAHMGGPRSRHARAEEDWRPGFRGLPQFVVETGLRPEEWIPLQAGDIDRKATEPFVAIRRTVSGGAIVERGKTPNSLRNVVLTDRALAALDAIQRRIDTPWLFSGPRGHKLLDLNTFEAVWRRTVAAAGIARPARIYDLRSTYASNAVAAGVDIFELARRMGTSTAMLERHYVTRTEDSDSRYLTKMNARASS